MSRFSEVNERKKFDLCSGYCGLACVDGSCPKANAEVYAERCMDVVLDCCDCFYYKGCSDCAFEGTKYCIKIDTDSNWLRSKL